MFLFPLQLVVHWDELIQHETEVGKIELATWENMRTVTWVVTHEETKNVMSISSSVFSFSFWFIFALWRDMVRYAIYMHSIQYFLFCHFKILFSFSGKIVVTLRLYTNFFGTIEFFFLGTIIYTRIKKVIKYDQF